MYISLSKQQVSNIFGMLLLSKASGIIYIYTRNIKSINDKSIINDIFIFLIIIFFIALIKEIL